MMREVSHVCYYENYTQSSVIKQIMQINKYFRNHQIPTALSDNYKVKL